MMAGGLLLPLQMLAAPGFSLESLPLPVLLSAQPGQIVQTAIKFKNDSPQPADLKVTLMKFDEGGPGGSARLLDPQPGDDYMKWVSFDRTELMAPSNVWQEIKMTIAVPKTAAFGYYYAVVISQAGRPVAAGRRGLSGAVATFVLLDVNAPGARRHITVQDLSADHRWYEFLPARFTVSFHNDGNVHAVPYGSLYVTGPGGQTVATMPINAGKGNVLPGGTRTFNASWDDGYPHYTPVTLAGQIQLDKAGQPRQHLVWQGGLSHFRLGKYTVHLVAIYNDGQRDQEITAVMPIYLVPWRFFLAVLAAVAVIGGLVYLNLRGLMRMIRARRS